MQSPDKKLRVAVVGNHIEHAQATAERINNSDPNMLAIAIISSHLNIDLLPQLVTKAGADVVISALKLSDISDPTDRSGIAFGQTMKAQNIETIVMSAPKYREEVEAAGLYFMSGVEGIVPLLTVVRTLAGLAATS